MTRIAPPGTWDSPLTAADAAGASVGLSGLAVDGAAICWIEARPREGRSVVVRWQAGPGPVDVTPPPWNARTRVHEYGGGAMAVGSGWLVFSHLPDQRLYRLGHGEAPRPLTPPGPWRFADGVIDPRRRLLFCVGERHDASPEPENCLVRIDLDGTGPPVALARGHDFYAAPRLSPDGAMLAWLAWRHPDMPWDGTELWLARVDDAGALREPRWVAGSREESVLEPAWTPAGALHVMSDRSGWWNLHRLDGAELRPLCAVDADCARPPWTFGLSHHCTLDDGSVLCAGSRAGTWRLWRVDPRAGRPEPVAVPFVDIGGLRAAPGGAVFIGGSTSAPPAVVHLAVPTGACTVLRRAAEPAVEPALVSEPDAVAFASAAGRVAHALHHRPRNPGYAAPPGSAPPLIVRCHGGPTSAASASFDPVVHFWTSRGFALLDLDHAGSSGYGRAYRRLLDGAWGLADVEDCVAAARGAVAHGWADPARLIVRGGSAGGFTALCALAFHDVFAAGASYYGIGDLEALRRDTHKFESWYDQRLIGPYPERRDRYRVRSPLHAADRIRAPVIFFQGLDDRVVPPAQSDAMAGALRARGVRVELVTFAGEGHGFRRADTIARGLEAELAFYCEVLGLRPEIPWTSDPFVV